MTFQATYHVIYFTELIVKRNHEINITQLRIRKEYLVALKVYIESF